MTPPAATGILQPISARNGEPQWAGEIAVGQIVYSVEAGTYGGKLHLILAGDRSVWTP